MNPLLPVLYAYKKEKQRDCLARKDLHSLRSDGTFWHGNCRDWCDKNSTCRVFTVYRGICFFKAKQCVNSVRNFGTVAVYIKPGSDTNDFSILKLYNA